MAAILCCHGQIWLISAIFIRDNGGYPPLLSADKADICRFQSHFLGIHNECRMEIFYTTEFFKIICNFNNYFLQNIHLILRNKKPRMGLWESPKLTDLVLKAILIWNNKKPNKNVHNKTTLVQTTAKFH